MACPFYNEIDEILGTRAATAPSTLLESSSAQVNMNGKILAKYIDTNQCLIKYV